MEGVCDTPLQFSAIYRKHNGPIEVGDARAYLHTRLELKARHELDDELVLFRDVDEGVVGIKVFLVIDADVGDKGTLKAEGDSAGKTLSLGIG